jgi:beta-lactamase regulating signal transducer with metallopeptidase domain
MSFIFLNQWIPEGFLNAVCWTLVHSIWQGVVTAILGGVIILTTKKAKASLRYNLLVLLFGVYLFVVGSTFVKQLSYDYQGNFSSSVSPALPNKVVFIPFSNNISVARINSEGLLHSLNLYFNEQAPFVVLVWFVFFMAQCLKLCSGLLYVRRLRKSGLSSSQEWQHLVQNLIERVGLKERVILMESSLINVPLTFGFLKSTLLVPLGLLSNLPPDQVETILLHELAHIRRKDYLVNLMQATAETIFFFNPGILWLSSLIRQEREACCDDIVLSHTAQKQSYLEALLSFQEYSLGRPTPVIALSVKKTYLLNRIKRMLTKENQKLNTMEKTMLLLGIIAFTAFGFINKTKAPESSSPLIAKKEIIRPGFAVARKSSDTLSSIILKPQKQKKSLKELP